MFRLCHFSKGVIKNKPLKEEGNLQKNVNKHRKTRKAGEDSMNLPEHLSEDVLTPNKLAVMIIDMQDYFLSDIPQERVPPLVRAQKEVLAYCKTHQVPVLLLEYETCGETIPEIAEAIKELPDFQTVRKKQTGGFSDASTSLFLETRDIKRVVLMGIYAGACIYTTASDAVCRGLEVIIAENLIDAPYLWKDVEPLYQWYQKKTTRYPTHTELLASLAKGLL